MYIRFVFSIFLLLTFGGFSVFGQEGVFLRDSDPLQLLIKKIQQWEKDELVDSLIIGYKEIGSEYFKANQPDSALAYYNKGANSARVINDLQKYAPFLYNISLVYLHQRDYKSALKYALEAYETDKNLNDKEGMAASLNSIALVYQESEIYDKAMEYRLSALKLNVETGQILELAHGNYNLGFLYVKLGQADEAVNFFKTAEKQYNSVLKKDNKNQEALRGLSDCQYSLGGIYTYEKEYESATRLFEQALSLKSGINDYSGIGNCYRQLGLIYSALGNSELSLAYYRKALTNKYMAKDSKGIALVYYDMGTLYLESGMTRQGQRDLKSALEDASNYLNNSLVKAKGISYKEIISEDYRLLSTVAKLKGEFKTALEYHQLHKAYADSVFEANMLKAAENARIRYETDKVIQDNKLKEIEINRQQTVGYYLIGLIILALFVVVVIYFLYNSKKKSNRLISYKNEQLGVQNRQIARQKKEIEEKNIDLTDSINYAKNIQDAMLEDITKLLKFLPEAFILFKPKDIVSGDFYWFGKKNNRFIVSAIDCTGHGVPGAFMSMLGNSFLDSIVLTKGETSPDKILETLSEEVQEALNQSETENKDGMDMALCSIDIDNRIVEFAGAKNPLVYIKRGEVTKVKGDKMPIGITAHESSSFTNHTIEVDEPTCFYMFSDGYQDQFGGPDGKKFMVKKLQNLLLEIHQKPMAEQKEILDRTIEEWMGDEEQVDDIILLGFRM